MKQLNMDLEKAREKHLIQLDELEDIKEIKPMKMQKSTKNALSVTITKK